MSGWPQYTLSALMSGRLRHHERVMHTPSESEPLAVRMMTDDVSGIGLWDQSVTHDER